MQNLNWISSFFNKYVFVCLLVVVFLTIKWNKYIQWMWSSAIEFLYFLFIYISHGLVGLNRDYISKNFFCLILFVADFTIFSLKR